MYIAIYDVEDKARKVSELRQIVARLADLDGENISDELNSRVSATESGHTPSSVFPTFPSRNVGISNHKPHQSLCLQDAAREETNRWLMHRCSNTTITTLTLSRTLFASMR